ncbi:MAG: hypothetical protein Q9195_008515 [Heterodermia aff. obscurata]
MDVPLTITFNFTKKILLIAGKDTWGAIERANIVIVVLVDHEPRLGGKKRKAAAVDNGTPSSKKPRAKPPPKAVDTDKSSKSRASTYVERRIRWPATPPEC